MITKAYHLVKLKTNAVRNLISVRIISGLTHKLAQNFSVQNYMKTYSADQIKRYHGRVRVDQNVQLYADPTKLQQFIKKQQALYEKQSKNWSSRTTQYLNRTNQRRDERTQSTTQVFNEHEYYTTAAWHEGREYSQIWRRSLKNPNRNQLVLDIMKYPQIKAYYKTVELTRTVFSPSGKYVAFGFDLHNNEQVSFMIKNINDDHIVGVKGWENNRLKGVDNAVFDGDNGIFYTKVIKYRPTELWYQNIRTGDTYMIYHQKDAQFYLDIAMAKDNKHLIISSNSKQESKIWMINTQKTKTITDKNNITHQKYQMKQLKLDKKGSKMWVNHNGKNFILWRQNSEGHQIVLLNEQNLSKEIPILKLAPQQHETITDIDIFQNHIALYIRKVVSPIIKIIQLSNQSQNKKQRIKSIKQLALPYQLGSVHPGANQMLKTNTFLFYLNNIFVYNQGYEYNFITNQITIKQPFKLTGPKFKVSDYVVRLHEVPTEDGELVPLTTIVPKRNAKNRNKMLLHVYGHYGLAYDISYNNIYWAALQNGWSLAYAHVRGGGQKGTQWHKSATKGNKYKNWHDLQECVGYLIRNQYTHPNVLVLLSHSAGSITIWNTINRYPHLYKAVIMSYPFLDMLGALTDSSIPLTQSDYAQFGNPLENIKTYNQIQSYSPYENIHENKQYPFIYLVAGTSDYRCPMDQIAKFVKRYRQTRTWEGEEKQRYGQIGEKGLLVKINEGSHEGIADLGDQLKDGCQMMACMDYLIEERSNDVKINK